MPFLQKNQIIDSCSSLCNFTSYPFSVYLFQNLGIEDNLHMEYPSPSHDRIQLL